jgi:phosphatidylinositol dimannoside acyltransferase
MQRRGMNVRKGMLRLAMPVLRALPPRTASRLLAGIGRTEYALLPRLRLRLDAAIAREANYFGSPWDVHLVGRDLAGNLIRGRTRDLLLDGQSLDRLEGLFQVRGREILDEASRGGRGVILLGNHFGAHMLPGHWLIRQGYPYRLFGERPRHISRLQTRQYALDGPLGQDKLFISRKANPAEAAGSILRAARVLKAGMILHIAGDVRWSGPNTAVATFLGRTYTFSNTWVILAAMTSAPVVPVFCQMEPDGANRLEFLPSFHVPPDASAAEKTSPWVQACLRTIEEKVQSDPANSNDYFFWTETPEIRAEAG